MVEAKSPISALTYYWYKLIIFEEGNSIFSPAIWNHVKGDAISVLVMCLMVYPITPISFQFWWIGMSREIVSTGWWWFKIRPRMKSNNIVRQVIQTFSRSSFFRRKNNLRGCQLWFACLLSHMHSLLYELKCSALYPGRPRGRRPNFVPYIPPHIYNMRHLYKTSCSDKIWYHEFHRVYTTLKEAWDQYANMCEYNCWYLSHRPRDGAKSPRCSAAEREFPLGLLQVRFASIEHDNQIARCQGFWVLCQNPERTTGPKEPSRGSLCFGGQVLLIYMISGSYEVQRAHRRGRWVRET